MTRHYCTGVPDAVGGKWEPQETCGFDVADVASRTKLNGMPDGVDGVVYLGMTSLNQQFKDRIDSWKDNRKVYAYYIVDEPVPRQIGNHTPIVPIETIKAMSDYIHETHPGAKTFVKCTNEGPVDRPAWSYTPANTGLDLIGVGGYAVRSRFPGGYDAGLIERYVTTALRDGIPLTHLVPVYQCFGGVADWPIPTRAQMDEMFTNWRRLVPNPPMDYAYRWLIQPQWGTDGLSNNQMMRDAIKRHFAAMQSGEATMDIRDLTARVQDLKARMVEIQNVLDVTANIRMREFITRISEMEDIIKGNPVTPAPLKDDAGRSVFTDDSGKTSFKGD